MWRSFDRTQLSTSLPRNILGVFYSQREEHEVAEWRRRADEMTLQAEEDKISNELAFRQAEDKLNDDWALQLQSKEVRVPVPPFHRVAICFISTICIGYLLRVPTPCFQACRAVAGAMESWLGCPPLPSTALCWITLPP